MSSSLLRYIDTHCNIPNILQKMKAPSYAALRKDHFPSNCEGAISVASDAASQADTLKIIEEESDVHGVLGIHPLYAKEYTQEREKFIVEAMKHPKVVAWGEIGTNINF